MRGFTAALAQLVEYRIVIPAVTSSILVRRPKFQGKPVFGLCFYGEV